MRKIVSYQKCNCGAITLCFDNGASNSMYISTFEKIKNQIDISVSEQLNDSYCCDHCANHWGIDICECGSGELTGECQCGSERSHDTLGDKFDSFGDILKNFCS